MFKNSAFVSVIVPARNEADTVASVVSDAFRSLEMLGVRGEVVVSASDCSDDTAALARAAGAIAVEAPIGKGAAIRSALAEASGNLICLVDGDVKYLDEPPLVALLVEPILHGLVDACVSDLYWRPTFPDTWMRGFFEPLAGRYVPELLPISGSTPWSGQRASIRRLIPDHLPDGYAVDLHLLLHWSSHSSRLRPIVAGDWTQPIRPKPQLLREDVQIFVDHALAVGRMSSGEVRAVERWLSWLEDRIRTYQPLTDDCRVFEKRLREASRERLEWCLKDVTGPAQRIRE